MATAERNTERSGSLVESHKGYNPRIIFFYFVVAVLLVVLAGGLAYQQLFRSDLYHEREKQQNQRRILIPGPRGNIYDRDGRLLVGNRARFAVTLYLDELRKEFHREYLRVRKNYRDTGDKDLPNDAELRQIARFGVLQRYLDQVNEALGRSDKLNADDLNRHFRQQLLLPYILVDDLKPEEYAKLVEQLPVRSPLQVYAASTRFYPYGSAAAHTLGFVVSNDQVEATDFPGEELTTFKMKGTLGRDGLEAKFDNVLQGETGGTIYRVDPAGYRVEPPLHRRLPLQGRNVVTSLDIDLQVTAEKAMAEFELAGAAVAIDVNSGEVLALASKPDYNLNDFSPRLSRAIANEIEAKGAWNHRAVNGLYPPGSTFKIVTSIAGLNAGSLNSASHANCTGYLNVGGRLFPCHGGVGQGIMDFRDAVASSCNIFFYQYGIATGADTLANEARAFHLHKPTGIELPYETSQMIVPDPAWKKKLRGEGWFPGDTANVSIGQGDLQVTPLQMACFVAAVARGQRFLKPTLLHQPNPTPQRGEPIGLTPGQYAALVEGMERCVTHGTAKILPQTFKWPIRVAGKTGTAQKRVRESGQVKTINFAWFICFAPVERPEIAMAVVMEGDTPDEELGGGRYAAPIAGQVLDRYFEKRLSRTPATAGTN